MPRIKAGEISLNYVEHGQGGRPIIFVHGNLGCIQWMDLVWPLLPEALHIYAYDWRGCGGSDKPAPTEQYANYSMHQHAADLLGFMDALGIEQCDLINHSTGSVICDLALLQAPDRFGRVLSLDPVAPRSMAFDEQSMELFRAMKEDRNMAWAGLASAAPTLFTPETLTPGHLPEYRPDLPEPQRQAFETVVAQTRVLSDGIWFGTPVNLTRLYESGELAARQNELGHPRLVVWGEQDLWIPHVDMEEMAQRLPHCRLRTVPGVGHAMNLEDPEGFAAVVRRFFT